MTPVRGEEFVGAVNIVEEVLECKFMSVCQRKL